MLDKPRKNSPAGIFTKAMPSIGEMLEGGFGVLMGNSVVGLMTGLSGPGGGVFCDGNWGVVSKTIIGASDATTASGADTDFINIIAGN